VSQARSHSASRLKDPGERQRVEKALRDSEQRLRAVLTSLPVLVIAYDRDKVCTIAEGRGLAAMGRCAEDIVGRSIDDLACDLPQMRESADRALAGERTTGTLHIGDSVLDTYHSPLYDDDGGIIGGLGVAVDVTERHRAELAAHRANARFQRGFVNSPVGMAVTDAEGCYLQVNPSFCTLLGRTEQELVGHHYSEVTPPADLPYADDVLQRMRSGELTVFQAEKRYTHATLGTVHVLVNSTAVRGDDGEMLYALHQLQDLTERRRVEEALRDSLDKLRKSDAERQRLFSYLVTAQEEERTRIAADVHDDSLQALAAVKMRLEMLTGVLSDEQRRRLESVERDLDAASNRLRRLLFRLRPTALDRDTLGHALEELLVQTCEGRVAAGVTDNLASSPVAGAKVVVYRIVQEAVANVLKHAHAQSLEIHLDDHDGGVLVTVRDDGIGFDYEQARRSQLPGHLGLSTMRERAEVAGGWLSVDTAPGRGTVVGFWVPRL
jgi:PAS domain S-box-containing protein